MWSCKLRTTFLFLLIGIIIRTCTSAENTDASMPRNPNTTQESPQDTTAGPAHDVMDMPEESPQVTTAGPAHDAMDMPEDSNSSDVRLTVRLSDQVVDENGQVIITCKAFNVPAYEFLRLVRVNDDGQLVIMASNKVPDEDFKPLFDSGASQRYKLFMNHTKEPMFPRLTRFLYSITIKPTQVEDSGVIGCALQHLNATSRLTVQAFPQSLELRIPEVQDKVIQVQKGMRLPVECRANGSHPPTMVTLMVGPHDLTSHLSVKTIERKEQGTVKGLNKIMFDTVLSGTIEVKSYFDGKKVQCKARMAGVNQEKLSKAVTIKMDGYPPSLRCEKVNGYTGQKNVVMRCIVTAKPAPTFKFFWARQSDKAKETMSKGERRGHYSASVSNMKKEHQYIMELKVDRVFPQMFREHTFEAANKFGVTKEKVLLERVESPHRRSSAPSVAASILPATFCAVLLIARHY